MSTPRVYKGGFTLIEIMVALAILSMGLIVLLDGHYASLRLYSDAQEELTMQSFMEQAVALAELNVLAGKLQGTGGLGDRYPEYGFMFNAQPADATQGIPLYQVNVTVNGPNITKTMDFVVYDMSQ